MTPEQQRIAIAEACGISTKCNCIDWGAMDHLSNCPAHSNQIEKLPNYLNDLNAMHEAEKTLTRRQWENYYLKFKGAHEFSWELIRTCMKSTAADRAENFLRTLNLWTE